MRITFRLPGSEDDEEVEILLPPGSSVRVEVPETPRRLLRDRRSPQPAVEVLVTTHAVVVSRLAEVISPASRAWCVVADVDFDDYPPTDDHTEAATQDPADPTPPAVGDVAAYCLKDGHGLQLITGTVTAVAGGRVHMTTTNGVAVAPPIHYVVRVPQHWADTGKPVLARR